MSVESSAYLRLLIFLSAILIPACVSSSPAFHMMCHAYKLNKQDDNIQPWHTPLPIWNQSVPMSSSKCCFLTCIEISQEAGQVVWYSHLSEFSTVCCDLHSQRLSCSRWTRSRCFFWNSLAFCIIQWVLAIWPMLPLPFLNLACTLEVLSSCTIEA